MSCHRGHDFFCLNIFKDAKQILFKQAFRQGRGEELCSKFLEKSVIMKTLSKKEILSLGLMMFSIFFGAGNLIFPPALGQEAGTSFVPAIIGFLCTGVGMPLLGVVAIAMKGGKYTEFIERYVHPKFALALLSVLYLTIGPLFAIPRTGAVSFEVGIRPFLGPDSLLTGQAMYTGVFFVVTYFLALNPSKLVARVGNILTPALLIFLVVLFVKSFVSPLGDIGPVTGAYVENPYLQGVQNGYLTMDLLASLAIGALVVNTIRLSGVEENREIGKVCIMSGVIAMVLMSGVYISLGYLGATSAAVMGHSANGGVLLTEATHILFGSMGTALLALIIALACLTTSCGMASAFAWDFHEAFGQKISYQRLLFFATLFSFAVSNVGLTELIRISVPFLIAIYPVVIVLVVLSLFSSVFGSRRGAYRWGIAFTLAFSIFDGLNAAGLQIAFVNDLFSRYIPLYAANFGWVVPAVVGTLLGCITSGNTSGELTEDFEDSGKTA